MNEIIVLIGQYLSAGGNIGLIVVALKAWAYLDDRFDKVEQRVARLEGRTA